MGSNKSQQKTESVKGVSTPGAPNPRRKPLNLTINTTLKEADIEKAMNLLTDWVDKRRAKSISKN